MSKSKKWCNHAIHNNIEKVYGTSNDACAILAQRAKVVNGIIVWGSKEMENLSDLLLTALEKHAIEIEEAALYQHEGEMITIHRTYQRNRTPLREVISSSVAFSVEPRTAYPIAFLEHSKVRSWPHRRDEMRGAVH